MACCLLGFWRPRASLGTAPTYCLFCTLVYLTAQVGTCCSGSAGSQTCLLPGLGLGLSRGAKACDGTLAASQPTLLAHQGLLTICCCSDLLGRGLEVADTLHPTHLAQWEHPAGQAVSLCPITTSESPLNWATSIPAAQASVTTQAPCFADRAWGTCEGLRKGCQSNIREQHPRGSKGRWLSAGLRTLTHITCSHRLSTLPKVSLSHSSTGVSSTHLSSPH